MFPLELTAMPSKPLNSPSPCNRHFSATSQECNVFGLLDPIFQSIWGMFRRGWKFGYDYCRSLRRKCNSCRQQPLPCNIENTCIVDEKYFLYRPWEFELSGIGAFRTESSENFAVDVENLYAVIVGVADNDSIGVTDGNVVWMLQITRFAAHDSEFTDKRAVWLENLVLKINPIKSYFRYFKQRKMCTSGNTLRNISWRHAEAVIKRYTYLNSVVLLVTDVDEA